MSAGPPARTADSGQHQIVVGVDGSSTATTALAWAMALAMAQAPGGPSHVRVVAAWYPTIKGGPAVDPVPTGVRAEQALGTARRTVARVVGAYEELGRVPVDIETAEGRPGPALLAAAREASLLVLGDRGEGLLSHLAYGATAAYVLNHAVVPVAIVPPDTRPHPPERIVVGVDGALGSAPALRWSTRAANALHRPLVLCHATKTDSDDAFGRDQVEAWLRSANAEKGADRRRPATLLLEHTSATSLLLRSATHSDLIVVGAHGALSEQRMVLGSVSRECVEQASCPVVVVP